MATSRSPTTIRHDDDSLLLDTFQKPLPKLVLLDRDGVVNEDVGAPGVIRKSQLALTSRAGHAIGRLKQRGCRVVLVTNQSCVGKGLLSRAALDETIHRELKQHLLQQDPGAQLDDIYVCTSRNDEHDTRKKPAPGMVLEACNDASIIPTSNQVIMIGDSSRDLEAAANAGVTRRFLVSTGYGSSMMNGRIPQRPELVDCMDDYSPVSQLPKSVLPFVYAKDLQQVVEWICL